MSTVCIVHCRSNVRFQLKYYFKLNSPVCGVSRLSKVASQPWLLKVLNWDFFAVLLCFNIFATIVLYFALSHNAIKPALSYNRPAEIWRSPLAIEPWPKICSLWRSSFWIFVGGLALDIWWWSRIFVPKACTKILRELKFENQWQHSCKGTAIVWKHWYKGKSDSSGILNPEYLSPAFGIPEQDVQSENISWIFPWGKSSMHTQSVESLPHFGFQNSMFLKSEKNDRSCYQIILIWPVD